MFVTALVLGLTSFGGPIAHLGYFHRAYVAERRWLSDATYADLVALCQLLPGPASSQVGIGIGLIRAGWAGALAAWLGFTLPSAVLMTAVALLAADLDLASAGWVHGLKLAAVAVVAVAILTMWRSLAPDWPRRSLAIAAAAATLLLPAGAAFQIAVIGAGAAVGVLGLRGLPDADRRAEPSPVSRRIGLVAASGFAVLLIGLAAAAALTGRTEVAVVEAFYRAGALVFGGGHVVLPLLAESVVAPGWVDDQTFLAGYGAAQAVPGPLFSFAAFLGASLEPQPNGIAGAAIAVTAIFLPSLLLVPAALAFWPSLRSSAVLGRALSGASAAVIGLLVAALVDPLWVSTVVGVADAALVGGGFVALVGLRAPAWVVVVALAVAGQVLQWLGVA